jgi:hypothetical protein
MLEKNRYSIARKETTRRAVWSGPSSFLTISGAESVTKRCPLRVITDERRQDTALARIVKANQEKIGLAVLGFSPRP